MIPVHRPLIAVAVFASAASAAAGDMLPLRRGIYVDRRVPCKGASNLATISYWGGDNGLNVAKAQCRIKRMRRSGSVFMLDRTCSGGQVEEVQVTVRSRSAISIGGVTYRYCGRKVRF